MRPDIGRFNEAIEELKGLRKAWANEPEFQTLYPKDESVLQTLYAQPLDAHRAYTDKTDQDGRLLVAGAASEHQKATALDPRLLQHYAHPPPTLRDRPHPPQPRT